MIVSPSVMAALQSGNVDFRFALWINAKNRTTGGDEPGGIHNGLDILNLTIEGQPRTYHGAGQLLNVGPIVFEEGLNVTTNDIDVSIISPEAIAQIRYHDVEYRPMQLHIVFLDPTTGAVLGNVKVIDGWINNVKIKEGKEDISATLEIVSSLRAGTKSLAIKRSHEGIKRRNPDDGFGKYMATSGMGERFWGTKRDKSGPSLTISPDTILRRGNND